MAGRKAIMAFGNGFTGFFVASIVTLSSGAAFVICFREFYREFLGISEEGATNTLGAGLEDVEVSAAPRAWENRSSYLWMVGFLGLIAIAGFVAGLAHFASR